MQLACRYGTVDYYEQKFKSKVSQFQIKTKLIKSKLN